MKRQVVQALTRFGLLAVMAMFTAGNVTISESWTNLSTDQMQTVMGLGF